MPAEGAEIGRSPNVQRRTRINPTGKRNFLAPSRPIRSVLDRQLPLGASRPMLDFEPWNTFEFIQIVGDDDQAVRQRGSGDLAVVDADHSSTSFEIGAEVGVGFGTGSIEIKNAPSADHFAPQRLPASALVRFSHARQTFGQDNGRGREFIGCCWIPTSSASPCGVSMACMSVSDCIEQMNSRPRPLSWPKV